LTAGGPINLKDRRAKIRFFLQVSPRIFDKRSGESSQSAPGSPVRERHVMFAQSKTVYVILGLLATLLVGAIVYGLTRGDGDRPHSQEGFKQIMEKKVHGRELFDGFTSDRPPGKHSETWLFTSFR
jgi:hypothetical protein